MNLRLATPDDAAAIADIYAPIVRDTVISFEAVPPDVAEMRQRIEKTLAAWPWLVAEDDGGVMGYAYAGEHSARVAYRWSANVSIYLHERARGQGLGRTLYTALFDVLKKQQFVNAYAGITPPNPASVGLHEAMGMRPVGIYEKVGYKFGAWQDVGWWQLQLQPWPSEPSPPIPLPDLHRTQVLSF